jgi:predicted  nucleic acid-binding Zn-ribbon protein
MNKVSILALAIMIAAPIYAQDVAVSTTVLDSLKHEVTLLKQANSDLAGANDALKKRVTSLENLMKSLQGESESIATRVSGTETGLAQTENAIRDTKSGLESQIQQTNSAVSDQDVRVKKKTVWGLIIAFIVLALSALLTFLLNRKGNAKIDALQGKAEKLNEEIVNRMSSEVDEIQKISASIGTLSAAGASSQNEQDLIKALADRITFMEMTLYRMDPSVRGYKQLTKSISQMKNNLLANGYEIVDMLGKPYHEGMKVTANFVEDENIEQGQQIITGIIKPQINYQGQMIQAAQITVSQNI